MERIVQQHIDEKEDFTNAYIWLLSGCAKMKNEKEMWWKDKHNGDITVEFVNLNPHRVVVRTYRDDGNKWTSLGHYDGWWHGKFLEWNDDGKLICDVG